MPSTMNTETAFAQFSTSISYMIFYRFLALICIILVMGSYIMLCSWYTLLTGSRIIEEYMEDIYSNINFPNFKILVTNAGEYLTQKMNNMSSFEIFKSSFKNVNIKKEKRSNEPLYTPYYDISDDNHSEDEKYDCHSTSTSDYVPSDSEYEEEEEDEVEDITEEYLAEKEKNKITVDLTNENDDDENDDDDDNDNENDEDSLPALISDSDEELEDIRDIMQDMADDRRESRREGST